MAKDDEHSEGASRELDAWARGFLIVAGIVLLIVGIKIFDHPPEITSYPPQCAKAECAGPVSNGGDGVPLALIGFGGLMALVGANGLRVASLKVPGGGFDADKAVAKEVKTALEGINPDEFKEEPTASGDEPVDETVVKSRSQIEVRGRELDVVRAQDLPAQVFGDLASHLAQQGLDAVTIGDIEWAARQRGRGNHPWFIELSGVGLWRVSYGGQAKAAATVAKVRR